MGEEATYGVLNGLVFSLDCLHKEIAFWRPIMEKSNEFNRVHFWILTKSVQSN